MYFRIYEKVALEIYVKGIYTQEVNILERESTYVAISRSPYVSSH